MLTNFVPSGGNVGGAAVEVLGVVFEEVDVAFTEGDGVELELLTDIVIDPTRCCVITDISIEEDWAGIDVSGCVDWLTLGECVITSEDGILLVLDV